MYVRRGRCVCVAQISILCKTSNFPYILKFWWFKQGRHQGKSLGGAKEHWGSRGAVPPGGVQGAEPLGGGQGEKPPVAEARGGTQIWKWRTSAYRRTKLGAFSVRFCRKKGVIRCGHQKMGAFLVWTPKKGGHSVCKNAISMQNLQIFG